MSGGGGEELPLLEIDPPERLFALMADPSVHGKTYRSRLYGAPIVVRFENDKDSERPPQIVISSIDPKCADVRIGMETDLPGWTCGACYLRAGEVAGYSDDDLWFGGDPEMIRRQMLFYLERAIRYGLVEYWQGTVDATNRPRGFSFFVIDRNPGWLKRSLEEEVRQATQLGQQHPGSSSKWYDLPMGLATDLLCFPIFAQALATIGIQSCLDRRPLHGRRYPPYPMD